MTGEEYYIGVDLGATTTRIAVADGDGNEHGGAAAPTPRGVPGDRVTGHVLALIEEACGAAGIDPGSIAAAGIGSIGPLDVGAGRVVDPANLPGVDHVELVTPIETLTGADTIHLRNDATAGVIGERFAHPTAQENMVYLTVSTGIGAGVIVDGHVLRGRAGNAGEVGHFVVDPLGDRACGCGQVGHWEAYAAGDAIPTYARDLYDADPVVTELPLDDLTARQILERPSDPLADRVIEHVTRWNAIGVANLVHAYAPDLVIVGGGVADNNPDVIVEPLRERVTDMVMVEPPDIRASALGERSVVRGALVSVLTDGTGER